MAWREADSRRNAMLPFVSYHIAHLYLSDLALEIQWRLDPNPLLITDDPEVARFLQRPVSGIDHLVPQPLTPIEMIDIEVVVFVVEMRHLMHVSVSQHGKVIGRHPRFSLHAVDMRDCRFGGHESSPPDLSLHTPIVAHAEDRHHPRNQQSLSQQGYDNHPEHDEDDVVSKGKRRPIIDHQRQRKRRCQRHDSPQPRPHEDEDGRPWWTGVTRTQTGYERDKRQTQATGH